MDKYSELKFRDDRFSIVISKESFSYLLDILHDEIGTEQFRDKPNVEREALEILGEFFLLYLTFKNNTHEVFELLKDHSFVLGDIENKMSENLIGMIREYVDNVLTDYTFRSETIYRVVPIPGVGIMLKSGESIWKFLYREVLRKEGKY